MERVELTRPARLLPLYGAFAEPGAQEAVALAGTVLAIIPGSRTGAGARCRIVGQEAGGTYAVGRDVLNYEWQVEQGYIINEQEEAGA